MKNAIVLLLLLSMIFWQGCAKEEEPMKASSLTVSVSYKVDSEALFFDTLMYVNDAGNPYSVYKLEYFLTQIRLIRMDGSEVLLKDYQYISADDRETNQIEISAVPDGNYVGMSFNIGVDPAHNVTGGLPNNVPNNNMEWPVMMGGGYHFMKFEGYFSEEETLYGYAMHLGKNENLVKVKILSPVSFNHQHVIYGLVMNLNEWFRNPSVYDFNIDGNYSMSDSLAMHKLMMNGADVFSRD